MSNAIDEAEMETINIELKSYEPPSPVHRDIISVISPHITDRQSGNEMDTEITEKVREDIPVESLYSVDILNRTTFVFRVIRDFLRAKGVVYNRHPATDRIVWGFVEMLYSDKDDIDFAYERLVQHKKSSRATIPIKNGNERDISPPSRSNPPDRRDSVSRIAHNMALRFKNRDKFTETLGEDLTEHINNYIDASQDYCLDQGNKLALFHNIFKGEAKRLYREKVREVCGNFGEAWQIMQNEYNEITRQNRIRKYLQSLRIQSLRNTKKLNTAEASEELREIITRFAPQGLRTHRSEEDKVEYLYKAVVGAPWAK